MLEEVFRRSSARLFFYQPTFSNSAGAVLPPKRRAAVLAATERHGAFVVEDDWARDFALDDDARRSPSRAAPSCGRRIQATTSYL